MAASNYAQALADINSGNLDTAMRAMIAEISRKDAIIAALLAKLDVLTAKLNADAGVTDTNYATDFGTLDD